MQCCSEKSSGLSRCFKLGVLAIAGIAAVAGIVMLLWNCLLPDLFPGVSPLGYWQALGLLILCRLLFGGLRGGFHPHWRRRRTPSETLSEEERLQLKGRFHRRWHACCTSSRDEAPVSEHAAGDTPTSGRGAGDTPTTGG